jgi:hypothetical protein
MIMLLLDSFLWKVEALTNEKSKEVEIDLSERLIKKKENSAESLYTPYQMEENQIEIKAESKSRNEEFIHEIILGYIKEAQKPSVLKFKNLILFGYFVTLLYCKFKYIPLLKSFLFNSAIYYEAKAFTGESFYWDWKWSSSMMITSSAILFEPIISYILYVYRSVVNCRFQTQYYYYFKPSLSQTYDLNTNNFFLLESIMYSSAILINAQTNVSLLAFLLLWKPFPELWMRFVTGLIVVFILLSSFILGLHTKGPNMLYIITCFTAIIDIGIFTADNEEEMMRIIRNNKFLYKVANRLTLV